MTFRRLPSPVLPLAAWIVAALGLPACSDYTVNSKPKPEGGAEAEDSGGTIDEDDDSGAVPDDSGTPGGSGETEPDPELATATNYVHTATELYAWEPSTGIARIGAFSDPRGTTEEITDLAIDLSGRMFAVSFTSLYEVDASTARLTYVATLDSSLVGLTFLSDGTLLGAGSGLYTVDITTGRLTVFPTTGGYSTSGDIVGMPDGNLYWTVVGDGFSDHLVRVDPRTGAATWIGDIGEYGLWGIGEVGGNLTGFSSGGRLVEIDPATARVTRGTDLPGTWWGATTNPVRW